VLECNSGGGCGYFIDIEASMPVWSVSSIYSIGFRRKIRSGAKLAMPVVSAVGAVPPPGCAYG
jgi:hypothetical protein